MKFHDVARPVSVSGAPTPVRSGPHPWYAAMEANVRFSACQSPKSGGESHSGAARPRVRVSVQSCTSRSDCGYGSGRNSTERTTLKIAPLAPIPSARVSSATAVNAGARRRPRNAIRKSCISSPKRSRRRRAWSVLPRRVVTSASISLRSPNASAAARRASSGLIPCASNSRARNSRCISISRRTSSGAPAGPRDK